MSDCVEIEVRRSSNPIGVGDGDRTRDIRCHRPTLYQLSYSHHIDSQQLNFTARGQPGSITQLCCQPKRELRPKHATCTADASVCRGEPFSLTRDLSML